MRVVVFSTDHSIAKPDSAAALRQRAYAAHFDAYDVLLRGRRWLTAWRLVRDADVVSAQDPFETGLIAWFYAALFKKPLHVQVHTDLYAPGFVAGHPVLNRLRLLIAPFVLRRAARIRVVLDRTKEMTEKQIAPHAPVSVLPIFVDVARLKSLTRTKHPQFKIALLVVSRLEKEKNVIEAIRALKAARDRGHDAGLTIVGSGSEFPALKAVARDRGLERHVIFTGAQDPLPHYAAADALLVPSFYEGYGMVIVEALAAGVPVIAHDVGIAREAGAVVAPEGGFSDTVVRWIESGPRRAELASYPYESFEEYIQAYCDDINATACS